MTSETTIISTATAESNARTAYLLAGSSFSAHPTTAGANRCFIRGNSTLLSTPTVNAGRAAVFAGASSVSAQGRRYGEPTGFGRAVFAGESNLTASGILRVRRGADFRGESDARARGTVDQSQVRDGVLSCLVTVRKNLTDVRREARARLYANGQEVPITRYQYSKPPESIGASLSFTLAKKDPLQIPANAVLDFDLEIWNGSGYSPIRLISGGILSGRNLTRGVDQNLMPTDELTGSTVDSIARRAELAPSKTHVYFNPALAVESPITDTRNLPTDADGNPIVPVITAIPGLDLKQALDLAYVTGCGFTRVVTDLPNVPVPRVEFSDRAGYHQGVLPLIQAFKPSYKARNNILYITDGGANVLPRGATVKPISALFTRALSATLPAVRKTDAVVLSFNPLNDDGIARDFPETLPPVESGQFGTSSFSSKTTVRQVREYRSRFNFNVILRRIVLEETTTERGGADGNNIISVSRLVTTVDARGLETQHRRTVSTRLPTIETGEFLLQRSLDVLTTMDYRPNPFKPGELVLDNLTTFESGLILVDSENQNQLTNEARRLPFVDAHANGDIVKASSQTTEFGAIKTTTKQLRILSEGQLRWEIAETNWLAGENGVQTNSMTDNLPGSAVVGASGSTARREIKIGNQNHTTAAAVFNGGDLPVEIATQLATRLVDELNNPPEAWNVSLPFPQMDLDKDGFISPSDRNSPVGNLKIKGLQITGENLLEAGRQAHTMDLNCASVN